MPIVDLTHVFGGQVPVFPGDPKPSIVQTAYLGTSGQNAFTLTTGTHAGTHVDAPMHMLDGGDDIASVPADRFVGRGVLIDARGEARIDIAHLAKSRLLPGDIVVLWTGWSDRYGSDAYYDSHPVVTTAFAHALVDAGISALGLDTPSPDRPPFPIHSKLLGAGILIIENLANVAALAEVDDFRVIALPLRIQTDASPVRVIAEF